MKKVFVLFNAFFVLTAFAKAQYVTIPDDNLRQTLMQNYPTCFNASEMMDTTCSAIVNETAFPTLGSMFFGIVTNWDGYQYFKNVQAADFRNALSSYLPNLPNTLKILTTSNASITSLPALPNGLIKLDCRNSSGLLNLPALPGTLKYLLCSDNYMLPSLPALPASLTYLDCQNDYALGTVPVLPVSLDTLICSYGNLTSLPSLPASLRYLFCDNNLITSLPVLPVALKTLNASYNTLGSLPALPASLEELSVVSNQLTALPALPSSLITLGVNQNSLTALPALPASLRKLYFNNNQVSSLPLLPDSLKEFDCATNLLTSLPASLPIGLTVLSCGRNNLHVLPALPLTLLTLDCYMDSLTSLPVLPPNLVLLGCPQNQLTSLPPLPSTVFNLVCSGNQIYFLPSLPPTLQYLRCENNNITCLPVLPVQPVFQTLDISMDDKINCIPNAPPHVVLTTYDSSGMNINSFSAQNYPLCSAVNNVHQCAAFPLMDGHVFYDNNNNLIKDAGEPYKANAKIQLSNGAYTMTNSNGYYQIPADSIGNYSATVTPPNYFTSVPSQYNYNFNSYDTLVTGNFALQATTMVDSLTISVLPINWAARPGFPFPYLISYQNVGTTTLSPNIVFNYDNTRLIYDSSSNTSVINSGSALSLAETGFVAGEQKAFVGYFTVKPSAIIGDSIHAYASIHANAITAYDSTVVRIRGSFDPNDKTATPALSPAQVANGNYIYYTIRFQNIGTDTAFSVVITDTLNSQLQAATLQVVNTSHPAKITVKGNVVYFEFINILLPDSNVNEMKSHGYVTFRMKPQSNLALNTVIPNKAAIYFDYNSPVITNTAVTNIVEPQGPLPLKLISFNVLRSTGNNANVFWNTSNEINVRSYNIEMSLDGRNFTNVAYEIAKGYQYNDYTKTIVIPKNDILYFRLKMIDVDGRFTYSPIVTLRNDKSNSFSFLNNPVKNELNISIEDDALKNTIAKIYNAQGLLVKTILMQHNSENINLRTLAAGTYYLVTEKGSRQFVIVK